MRWTEVYDVQAGTMVNKKASSEAARITEGDTLDDQSLL
jgi:hypothetical protein